MSQPSFPELPTPSRDDAISLVLSSIAMEELGLSHIINAEGEKIQFALGTLPGVTSPPATIDDVLALNESVRDVLDSITQTQMFLNSKIQAALSSSPLQGPTGPTGPTGAPGPNLSSTAAYAANTIGSTISTLLGPASVPLPNNQVLSPDITINGSNTVFTVATPGRYRISYQINSSLALLVGSRLVINGAVYPPSVIQPVAVALSNFKNEVIVDLAAGSTITLQLFGLLGVTILLNNALGASLMIIRLS